MTADGPTNARAHIKNTNQNNWYKQRRRVAEVHARTSNKKRDFITILEQYGEKNGCHVVDVVPAGTTKDCASCGVSK